MQGEVWCEALEQFDRLTLFESELLDPLTNGSLSSSGAIIGMQPGYMIRDEDQRPGAQQPGHQDHNYNRWLRAFKYLKSRPRRRTGAERFLTYQRGEKFYNVFCMAKANSWSYWLTQLLFHLLLPTTLVTPLNKKLQLFLVRECSRAGFIGWLSCAYLVLTSWYNSEI